MTPLDGYGIPIVKLPPVQSISIKRKIIYFCLYHIVFPLILPPIIIRTAFKLGLRAITSNIMDLHKTVSKAHLHPIDYLPLVLPPPPPVPHVQTQNTNNKEQDNYKHLIGNLWTQPSAQHYIKNNALEYQKSEGYCGRSTLRNILKSFPSFPQDLIPPQSGGASDPSKWSKVIHDIAEEHDCINKMPNIETTIISGDIPYKEFMEEIKKALEDPGCRIALNYLRPALVGFRSPAYIPVFWMLSLMSGHFSPIIGIMDTEGNGNGQGQGHQQERKEERECMIGVFDVNHKYGGAYLVPSKMLYESVKAHDLMTGQSRAIVILRMGGHKKE
jgi:hypothetical protein